MKHLKHKREFEFKDDSQPSLLDRFEVNDLNLSQVTLTATEVTSLCPITHQPDYHKITISYIPTKTCVESKSLKLYLGSWRQVGIMTEPLCYRIAQDLFNLLSPRWIKVIVSSAFRGGISVEATSILPPLYKDRLPK